MRPLTVQLVRRRLRDNERRRRFARKMVMVRRTRWPRAAWRWLCAPSGLSRGGFLLLITWILAGPWIGGMIEAHHHAVATVLIWVLNVLIIWGLARIAWLLLRWRRRRHG